MLSYKIARSERHESGLETLTKNMFPPEIMDVTDFAFRQLRKLKIAEPDELHLESSNLLTSSTRFGLVFVGCRDGFKVIGLDVILDLDDPQKRAKEEATEFPCWMVPLPSNPDTLALSCDSLTLAVCIVKEGVPFLQLFDVRAFVPQHSTPAPFKEICLSSTPGVRVRDVTWNPAVAEVFAVCTTDGALGVYEVSGTSFKITASLSPQSASTALCWSPKGKQLVVGKADGRLVQYKPNLQETKVIPPPSFFENPVCVVSVHWLSTTQFAGVYVSVGEYQTPYVVISNLTKGESPSYVNYGDVCFGRGDRVPYYLMYHQPEWHILVCTSNNALETVVLGHKDSKQALWEQWNLDDRGRAELPLLNHEETSALGMDVISCSQRRIVVSDNEMYPPMPILLLLSSSGLLCPFHMVNARQDAGNLVSIPEPVPAEGERRGLLPVQSATVQQPSDASFVASMPIQFPTPTFNNVVPSNFCEESAKLTNSAISTPADTLASAGLKQAVPFTAGESPFRPQSSPLFPVSTAKPVLSQSNSEPIATLPGSGALLQQQFPGTAKVGIVVQPALQKPRPQSMVAPVSPLPAKQTSYAKPDGAVATPGRPILVPVAHSKPATAQKQEEKKPAASDTFTLAIMDEMAEFEKEIAEMKASVGRNNFSVGTKEELGKLRRATEIVDDFCRDIKETMQSLNSDIHTLKSSLLESFAFLEDAKSRDERNRDSRYISLLRHHPLDPVSARRIREIRRLYQYLDCQFQEVNNRLDQDWKEYSQLKAKNARLRNLYPSMQALYRTLLNNHNLLGSLRYQLERLSSQTKDQKLRRTPGRRFLMDTSSLRDDKDDLSTLADTLLETKLSPKESSDKRNNASKLTPAKEATLRDFLCHRQIRTVKAKQLDSLSQSRIFSLFRLSKTEQKSSNKSLSPKSPNLDAANVASLATPVKSVVSLRRTISPMASTSTPQQSSGIGSGESLSTTSNSHEKLGAKFSPKAMFQPSPSGAPPPNVSVFRKPVPISSSVSLAPSVPEAISAPSKSFAFGSQIPSLGLTAKPTSAFAFGSMSTTTGAFTFKLPLDAPSAKKPTSAFDDTALSFGTSPPALKLQAAESSKHDFPSSKSPFVAASSAFTFQSASSLSAFTSPFAAETMGPKVSASEIVNNNASPFEEEQLPKYDNITPPDSPRPILSYEEDNSQEITEETKVIEIDVGGSSGRSSSPFVKVSSVSSPFSLKLPPSTFSALSSPSATTKSQQTGFSFALKGEGAETNRLSPSSDTVGLGNLKQKSNDSPIPSGFTFSSSSVFKGTKSPLASSSASTFSFSAALSSSSEDAAAKPAATSPQQTIAQSDIKMTTSEEKVPVDVGSSEPQDNVTTTTTQSAEQTTGTVFSGQGMTITVLSGSAFGQPATPLFAGQPTGTTSTSTFGFAQKIPSASETLGQSVTVPTTAPTSGFVPDVTVPVEPIFGLSTPIATSSFGQTPSTTTGPVTSDLQAAIPPTSTGTVFGQTTVDPTSAPSIFGQALPTTTVAPMSAFGQPVAAAMSTTSSFGQATVAPTSGAPMFGQATVVSTATIPVFGQTTVSSTSPAPTFGQTAVVTASPAPTFGQAAVSPAAPILAFGQTTTTSSPFGQSAPSIFGSQTTSPQSAFGSPNAASTVFAQASSVFGKQETTAAAPLFRQSAPLFGQATTFGQTQPSGASVFGQPSQVFGHIPTSGSIFGGQATTTSSSVFGQSATSPSTGFSFAHSNVFGQNQNPTFGQQPGSGTFGSPQTATGGIFGQGTGFFGGLGGKPSAENAGKNVFGAATSFGSPQTQGTSLFGNQGANSFGNKFGSGFGGGSFSSATGGSVAQSGFGAFQQSPQKSGTFGAAPVFGSTFGGSSSSFGGTPTFGGSPPVFSTSFGSPPTPGFGTFGATNPATTFGSLANQNQAPTFGNLAQTGGGFGAMNQQASPATGFGSAPAFGSGTGFGQGTFGSQSSAFSQWRQ